MEKETKKARGAPKKPKHQRHEVLAMIRFSQAQDDYIQAQDESRSVFIRRVLDAHIKKNPL